MQVWFEAKWSLVLAHVSTSILATHDVPNYILLYINGHSSLKSDILHVKFLFRHMR